MNKTYEVTMGINKKQVKKILSSQLVDAKNISQARLIATNFFLKELAEEYGQSFHKNDIFLIIKEELSNA